MNDIQLRKFTIGNAQPLTLMGGMNVLESRDLAFRVAEEFKSASDKLEINYIFKGSFDKANRSSGLPAGDGESRRPPCRRGTAVRRPRRSPSRSCRRLVWPLRGR